MSQQKVTIYHNPRCSKSRETLNLLTEQGIEPEVVEYMKTQPDQELIRKLQSLLGLDIREMIRSNEKVYKDAGLDDENLTDDALVEAVSQCPSLLQRPIVVVDDQKAAIGRPPESVLDIL